MTAIGRVRKKRPWPLIGLAAGLSIALALVWLLGGSEERQDVFSHERVEDPPASANSLTSSVELEPPASADITPRGASDDKPRSSVSVRGRIRGTVVDVRTKEPVPAVDVRLHGIGAEEIVRTGAHGEYASTRELAAAGLVATVSDVETVLETFTRDQNSKLDDPWSLEVPIGPTYPLLIDKDVAIDPAQWRARVVETTRNPADAGEIDVGERGLRMAAPLEGAGDREWTWLDLRAGEIPWIRYSSVKFGPDPRYRLRVEVHSEVVGRRGFARTKSTVGVQEPVIADALKNVGALRGRVIDESGAMASGSTLLLLPHALIGEGDHTPMWDVADVNDKGEFHFQGLGLGRRRLLTFAPGRPIVQGPIVVNAGALDLEEPVQLPPKPALVAPDPSPHPSQQEAARPGRRDRERPRYFAHVRLVEAGDFVRAWLQPVSDAEIWSHEARLDVSHMPLATLAVEWPDLLESRTQVRPIVQPWRMQLSDPGRVLDLSRTGGRDSRAPRFSIDGDPDESKDFDVSFEPGGALIGELPRNELRVLRFTVDTRLSWAVWRAGFAPAFGDETGFTATRRELTLRVQLAAGWGAVLWCRATDGASKKALTELGALGYLGDDSPSALHQVLASPPLPNVRVLADQVLASTSDAEGVVRLALGRMPQRLVLVADGWHMTRLVRLPLRTKAAQRYVVWMERD